MSPAPPARRAVLERVAAAVPSLGRPVLVVVDGADGAGKTWFADDLATTLKTGLGGVGHAVVRASVDDFHHPREHRHADGRTGETVWRRSYDYRALRRELVDPWCAGAGAPYRRRWHDLATDTLVDDRTDAVPDRGVLVVDGVFAQRDELRDCWDVVVWLDVPDHERVRRLAARDGVPPDPAHPDQARYLDAQALYRRAADPVATADVVVDNTDPLRPVLVERPPPAGWSRFGDRVTRTITTDAATAERIDRLLEG